MKIKFDMSWGNAAWPKEYNAIKISNIPDEKGRFLSFFYKTLSTKKYPTLGGRSTISYIYYDKIIDRDENGVIWDVPIKEIHKCIIKIFTKLDEIEEY